MAHLPLRSFALPLVIATALPAQCELVLDINQTVSSVQSGNPTGGGTFGSHTNGPGGATVSSFAKVGNTWFFAAETGPTGLELWKTNGTTAGTVMVKDINPGPGDSNPSLFEACNGVMFFTCDDGTHGRELWKSDGTAAGTVLVKDILNGSTNSSPSRLVCVGNQLYFGANWNVNGFWALYRTNGTAAGTVEILTSGGGHVAAPDYIQANAAGNGVYFQAYVGSNRRLWKSNGTNAGTMEIVPAGGLSLTTPRYFHNVNGVTIFSAAAVQAGAKGIEPCVTDGTSSGTFLLKDIYAGFIGSNPNLERVTRIGNEFFFGAADGSPGGAQLWKTNGTSAGTVQVGTIAGGGYIDDLHVNGNTLFFTAQDSNGRELWKYSGGSISMVKDIFPGGFGSSPHNFASWSNGVAFRCSNATFGSELWVSNGTAGGTYMAKDIRTGSTGSYPEWMTALGGNQVICVARDDAHGKELWLSDGTTAGTVLLKDCDPVSTTASSSPSNLTSVNGNTLLFAADDGNNGREVWQTNGAGTAMLADLEAGGSSSPRSFVSCWTDFGNYTFFIASTAATGEELWVNSPFTGVALLKDIFPGPSGSTISDLTPVGNHVLFAADDGVHGKELWISDGTPPGTTMVADILPGAGSSIAGIGFFAACNGALVFAADDGVSGTELWLSNGTAVGTVMIADIEPGAGGSQPNQMECIGDRVVFAATTTAHGSEPWSTNGLPGGTTILNDIAFLTASSGPNSFTTCGDRMLFVATNAAVGGELWQTDGTPAGTTFLKDIATGPTSSLAHSFTCCDDKVFFTANNGLNGNELWVTDGTGAGTQMVADINPGSANSSPSKFVSTGSEVYFAATAASFGNELWISDGTPGGTSMVCDLKVGSASGAPDHLTICNGELYFVGNDAVLGAELFKVTTPAAISEVLGAGCAPFQPSMRSNAPTLGGTLQMHGSNTPFGHLGIIAFGQPSALPVPTPVTGTCPVWLDLLQPVVTLGTIIFTPTWTDSVTLPSTPSLAGSQLTLQTFYLHISGQLPLLTSNGVLLTVGS